MCENGKIGMYEAPFLIMVLPNLVTDPVRSNSGHKDLGT